MLLSIIVISHDQREQLKRCVDSILAQQIPFEYEVLISDDASKDGSFELAQEYAECNSRVQAYSCDTNKMNASNTSSRAGYNRCNALQHAKGKYIAHIDGDDFLLADSKIYQKQVELLEKHPECSCCMANDYNLVDGEELGKKVLRHEEVFETGYVLKKEDYIRNYFRESHCFVYRNQRINNPIEKFDGYYDDNLITAFYVQFGDIVCLDDAGYVYMQYAKSLWHDIQKTNDYKILSSPELFNSGLYPVWKPIYWSSPHKLGKIKVVVRSALHGERMSEETRRWMDKFDYYLFHVFNRPLTIADKVHLYALLFLLGVMRRTKRKHPTMPLPWQLLDKLL